MTGFRGALRGKDGVRNFPRHMGQGKDGTRKIHAGRGRRPHPSAPPHPIAIPNLVFLGYWWQQMYCQPIFIDIHIRILWTLFMEFWETNKYTRERERVLTQMHTTTPLKSYGNFKGWWDKLYYTQHTLLNNMGQLPFFFFFEKQTHTQGEKNGF